MYKRYIGTGINVKEALLLCKVNRLAYSKNFDDYDITSRTRIILMDIIENETAANMEKMLLFAYFYKIHKNKELSTSENKYYKKLKNAYGKKNLNEILDNFCSKEGCIGIKETVNKYRIIYFTK